MRSKRGLFLAVGAMGLALVGLLLFAQGIAAGSPQPKVATSMSWSSGWTPIAQGATETFTHNLGGDPDDYAVELWFLDTAPGGMGINRRGYGGLDMNGNRLGAHWERLTSNTIDVFRGPQDLNADRVLVRVWVVPTEPEWDSGWRDIQPGETLTLTHGRGTTATDLTVGLWFSGTRGIHHLGYGGLAINSSQELRGAHWHDLTDDTVEVTRHPDDPDVEQVRVVVVEGDPPDYDSLVDLGGWQTIGQGASFRFEHDLQWDPSMMMVRAECNNPGNGGIHQWLAGGSVKAWGLDSGRKGANGQRLTANTVDVYRWPEDDICHEVRVRIWRRAVRVFLPFVAHEE